MSRKKKRPLPPRTLRMNRHGRLKTARSWLELQRGRPPQRIARSYRQRFGVDWLCAIAELTALGIQFPVQWLEQIALTLENARLARVRRRAERNKETHGAGEIESDDTFAFIAGYTEGGAPFGVTWEEWSEIEKSQRSAMIGPAPDVTSLGSDDADQLPF